MLLNRIFFAINSSLKNIPEPYCHEAGASQAISEFFANDAG